MAKFRVCYQTTKQDKPVSRYIWGKNESDAMFNLIAKHGKVADIFSVEKVN